MMGGNTRVCGRGSRFARDQISKAVRAIVLEMLEERRLLSVVPVAPTVWLGNNEGVAIQWQEEYQEPYSIELQRSIDDINYAAIPNSGSMLTYDASATPGDTYYYRVTDGVTTTPSSQITLPEFPAPTLTDSGDGSGIALSWSAFNNTYDGYTIDRLQGGAGFDSIGTSSGLSYTDTQAVDPSITYTYRVRAGNFNSESVSITPCFAAPTAAEYSLGTVSLSWPAYGSSSSYSVQRSTDGVEFSTVATLDSGQGTSWSDSYVSPATAYYYRIVTAQGYTSQVASVTTRAPFDAPSLSFNNGVMQVAWAGHGSSGSYSVERSTDGYSFNGIGTTSSTSLDDTSVPPGYTYYYRVYDGVDYSGTASMTVSLDPLSPPSVAVRSPYAARIQWTIPANSGTTAVRILRNGTAIEYNGSTTFYGSGSVDDMGLTPETDYEYRVEALDGYLYGQVSDATPIHTPRAKPLIRVGASTNKVITGQDYVLRVAYQSVPGGPSIGSLLVDWGDGSAAETFTGTPDILQHAYAVSGQYTITVTPRDLNESALMTARVGYDWGFGSGGVTVTDLQDASSDDAAAVARDGQGRLLVAATVTSGGKFALLRYNSDGTLDTTFGTQATKDGKAFFDFGNNASSEHYDARASSLVIDDLGRIYVAGDVYTASGGYDFAVVRFNPDGTLDTTFGAGGEGGDGGVITDFGALDARANAIAIDWFTGDIVVAGYADGYMALARYDESGTLDTAFDTDGKLTVDLSARADIAYAVKFDGLQRIVVAGRRNQDMAVLRFNGDGSADSLFGSLGDGESIFNIGAGDHAYDIDFDALGRIVVAGSADGYFALARLEEDGDLDLSFSTDGWLTDSRYDGSYLWRVAVEQAGDGEAGAILAGGNTVAARYLDDGTLDANFGDNGIIEWHSTGGEISDIRALAMFNFDNQITIVGQTIDEYGASNIEVMRFFADNRVLVVGKEPTITVESDPGNPTSPVEGDSFTILLSASQNSDEDVITGWVILANDQEFYADGTATSTTITLPSGHYTITVRAVGTYGDIYSVTSDIEVDVPNVAPTVTIDSPATTSFNEGDVVSLHASGSDPGNDYLEYTWNVTKDGNPFATGSGVNFDFILDDDGEYIATVTVDDGEEGTDTASQTVTATNVAPTADPGAAQTVNEGDTVYLYGSAIDPGEADGITYAWRVTDPDDQEIDTGNAADFSFTVGDDGDYVAELTVEDDDGGTDIRTVTIHADNVAPAIKADIHSAGTPEGHDQYAFDPSLGFDIDISDPGGDEVNYVVNWGEGTPDSGTSTTPGVVAASHVYPTTAQGNHLSIDGRTITITGTDADGLASTDQFDIAIGYVNDFQDENTGGWDGAIFHDEKTVPSIYLGADDDLAFQNDTAALSLATIPSHDVVYVSLRLYVLGNLASGDDWLNHFTFTANGQTLDVPTGLTPTGSGPYGPLVTYDIADPPSTGSFAAAEYDLTFAFVDSGGSLDFAVQASGLATGDGSASQHWLIGDVRASVDRVDLVLDGLPEEGRYGTDEDDDGASIAWTDLATPLSSEDPRLKHLAIVTPDDLPSGTMVSLQVESGADEVVVYITNPSDPLQLIPILDSQTTSTSWVVGTDVIPDNLFARGIGPSSATGQVVFRLLATAATGQVGQGDRARAAVDKVSLVIEKTDGTDLPEQDKASTGGFVPVNNDDDDYDGKIDMNDDEVTGDDTDFLKLRIVTSRIIEHQRFRLTYPEDKLRIWTTKGKRAFNRPTLWKSGVVESDTEFFVEGLGISSVAAAELIKVEWMRGAFADDASRVLAEDTAKLTVFEISGPENVPHYSTHNYQVTIPMTADGEEIIGSWSAEKGLVTGEGDQYQWATIYWNQADAAIGKAIFAPAPGFAFGREVNIVKVTIEAPPPLALPMGRTLKSFLRPANGHLYNGDVSSVGDTSYKALHTQPPETASDSAFAGMRAAAKITLAGPSRFAANEHRGVNKIHIDFIQNLTIERYRATYWNSTELKLDLEGGTYVDYRDDTPGPFYMTAEEARFHYATPTKLSKVMTMSDSPDLFFPISADQREAFPPPEQDLDLNEMEVMYKFSLFIVATTIETVNDANLVYTALGRGNWQLTGNGSFGPQPDYKFTEAPPRNRLEGTFVVVPKEWTMVKGMITPMTDGPSANERGEFATFVPV